MLTPRVPDDLPGRWLARLPTDFQKRRIAAGVASLQASLLGLALFRSCAREAGLDPDWGVLEFPEGGKPQWRGGEDFSITHAGGRVACALAPRGVAVGLDLEPRAAATPDSLRLVMTDQERDLVAAGRLDAAALWTRKEALLKAAGLDVRHAARAAVGVDWGAIGGRRYRLLDVSIAHDMACAVAVDGDLTATVVREVDGGVLLSGGP